MNIFGQEKPWRFHKRKEYPLVETCVYDVIADQVAIRHPEVGKGMRLVSAKLSFALYDRYGTDVRLEAWDARNGPDRVEALSTQCYNLAWRLVKLSDDPRYPLTPEESCYFRIEALIYSALEACYRGKLFEAEVQMERARSRLRALVETGTTLFPTQVSAVKYDGERWRALPCSIINR